MKFLKAIMIVAVMVTALGLGACAKKQETVTTSAGTTGYSKQIGRLSLLSVDPLPPTKDLVTSRILWLDGMDEHNANTHDRFIYIDGTKHEDKTGNPASHGCVRMRNEDVIELFDLVDEGTPVLIEE